MIVSLLSTVCLGRILAAGFEDGWIADGLARLWERLRRPAGPEARPAARLELAAANGAGLRVAVSRNFEGG